VSALRELIGSVDATLRPHGVQDPPAGEFEARIDDPTRGFVLEAVREGYLLHYGAPGASRILADHDVDLALLAGDRLYALGLERLADAGDLSAVSALADVIALCAQASAAGDDELSGAVWAAGCAEVGWGSSDDLEAAKEGARAGVSDAAQKLRTAARHVTGQMALPR
jgi:hypothetical protein